MRKILHVLFELHNLSEIRLSNNSHLSSTDPVSYLLRVRICQSFELCNCRYKIKTSYLGTCKPQVGLHSTD